MTIPWLSLPVHVAFVTGSALLLFAPFVGVWAWRTGTPVVRGETPGERSRKLDEAFRAFCDSTALLWLLGAWAALEATIWFIIPEFPLLLTLFLRRTKAKWPILVAYIAGSILGASVAYGAGAVWGTGWLEPVPYLTAPMLGQADVWLTCLGPAGLSFQPYSGVPVKVFGATAHGAGLSLWSFVVYGLFVRFQRYGLVYAALIGLSAWRGERIARTFWYWIPVILILYTMGLLDAVSQWAQPPSDPFAYRELTDMIQGATGYQLDRC